MIRGRSAAMRSCSVVGVHSDGGYRTSLRGRGVRDASRRRPGCIGTGHAVGTVDPARTRSSPGRRGTRPRKAVAARLGLRTVRWPRRAAGPARRGRAAARSACSPKRRAAPPAVGRRSTRPTPRSGRRPTSPRTLICRSSSRQSTVNAPRGFSASSRPFLLSTFVKKEKPSSSTPRSSTCLTEGAPWASAVASAIAFASGTCAARGIREPQTELRDRVQVEVVASQLGVFVRAGRGLHRPRVAHRRDGTSAQRAPGRIRTCASGSGGRRSIP